VNKRRLLERTRNSPQNVRFSDLLLLVEAFGYRLRGQEGSHAVYTHEHCPILLSLQPDRNGKAKAYQVRQFLKAVTQCDLAMEEDDV
jgi:hypothetical protein